MRSNAAYWTIIFKSENLPSGLSIGEPMTRSITMRAAVGDMARRQVRKIVNRFAIVPVMQDGFHEIGVAVLGNGLKEASGNQSGIVVPVQLGEHLSADAITCG